MSLLKIYMMYLFSRKADIKKDNLYIYKGINRNELFIFLLYIFINFNIFNYIWKKIFILEENSFNFILN